MKAKLYKIFSVLAVFFFCLTTFTAGAVNIDKGTKLYLKPNSNWTQSNARFAAYFYGNGEKWISMTEVSDKSGYYEVTQTDSKSYPNVIFCRMNPSATANNWNNKWDQTGDLVYDGCRDLYTVKSGTWSNGGGDWSSYDQSIKILGVGGDWDWADGLTMTSHTGSEVKYMCLNVANKESIKVVKYKCDYYGNGYVKDGSVSVDYDKDANIVLSKGVYDLYFDTSSNKLFIGYSIPKEAYLVGLGEDKKMTYNSSRSQYELKNVAVKSTDNVKAKLVYECGNVEYVALDTQYSCGTVKSTADGLTFKKDGNYDFYFKLDNYQFYVEANATNKTKYLLMGVNTDWDNGIELVKNPDNGSEWMALGVEINAERDAVQIVTKDLCREDDAFCNNVKYSTTVPYYVKDNNIILETGTYDFYFNPTENKVHIEGEVKKAVTVYLDINGKDWNNGRVALYYYNGDATRWVSAIACDGDNNIYYAQIPRGFDTYIWVKLKKDTDNSFDNKEKTEDQTVNIKLNSLQNLAKLTDDKDNEWHLKVEFPEYTGYCKQEFPIQVELLNEPVQDGSAWKLDAQVVGEVGAQIEEYGFFINRSLEKGGAFVTENLNAGKVSAEISAENEKIFEGKASYNLLPGYWHGYRAYVKVNGEYSLSTTTKWFEVKNTCSEYKYETIGDSVLVHINSNVPADPCNFVFNSFEQAFAVLRGVDAICESETKQYDLLTEDVITLEKPVIMLVHFAAEPYRGSEEVGVSGGHINDAPAIFFRNINMNGEGAPLIVRTADPNGNRAVIVHPVIRRSTNITLDNLDIISDSNLRDNAIDIDNGQGENNLEGLNKDFNLVPLSKIDHKITLKNSQYISYGRNCIHVVGIKGLYVENNEFYTKYDFTANISEGADVIDWGGTIKFINVTDVKFLRNNSEGTLATSFFLQGCQRILLMNNVFWNDNAVAVPNVESEGRSVANVRLVSYTVNIADAEQFPIKNIGIYYNTFFIKNNDLGAGSYHKFDFFRLGGLMQPVDNNNKGNYDPTSIRFQYNNCYSYDEDITGNNDDATNTQTFYLQGIGRSTDWCQCFVYNNFWSKYDEKEHHTSSSFELGKYCTGVDETYNLYASVDDQVCATDPEQPGALVVKGDAWNIGTVITEKEDVSKQGAHLIFNDRLNPDNGVNSIRPQVAVDNSNEALSPYDKVYLEPGTINLFTSPIVGSQTTDVYVTSIKLTANSVVNLSIVDKNDNPLSDGRFALTNASGESISSLKTDAEGSLDNEPVYITFVRPDITADDPTYEEDPTYEAFLKIVPAESASADEQLLLRIPLRGHHKSKLETIGGAWTVGAFQQRDPKPVDKIIWHGLTSDEWDNRNNWYKEDGTLVTCLDALTEDLTVIIPAKDSEKYLTPVHGVEQYPILPKIASEDDFKEVRQNKWKGEQVNAGNSGKVANKIVMEYGAALVGVEELGEAVRYTEVEQEFVARRNDWLLVGTVVKPWDVDEEGKQITRNVISNDYYLYHLPHVYMHEAKVVTNDENEVTAEWQTSFANLDVEVPQDRAFAIRIPNQYGPKKFPAEVYNRREGTNYNEKEAIRYTFTGRFYNESSLPTYSLLQQGEPVILTNTYPANIDAQKLQAGKGNGEGSVQYYDYNKKAFIPLGSDAKSIMSQHSFIFTPKAELAKLKVDRDYFQTTETGHRSASVEIEDFRVELINRADNTASEIYIRYDELKEDAIDYAVDAPKVFNSMESTLGDLYVMRYDRKWAALSIPTMSEPIPLGVKVSTADKAFTFSLGASNIEEDIILEDRQTGAQYNLSKGENYRVEGLQVGNCEGRFYLMLSENEEEELPEDGDEITTDAEDTEYLANGIDIFTQENSIVVSCNSEMELMQVVVSDVAGRHQVYNVSGQYVKLDLPVSTGVYTISVIGDKATRVEKIKLN